VAQHHPGRGGRVGVLSHGVDRLAHHVSGGAGWGLEREQVGLGHDPDHPVAVVDHGHRVDPVLDQGGGHVLEVGVRPYGDHGPAHHVTDAHGAS
jgi:hypothetical protein